jgi:CheY-like chemotaxis protein
MAQAGKSLNGVRILVVEDNFLAAEVVRDLLESSGCAVVGPVGRIADALRLAEHGAILDVNLNGERCFPIALALRQRGVPFVFLTGYDDEAIIPVELRPARRLGKPVFGPQLMAVLAEVI